MTGKEANSQAGDDQTPHKDHSLDTAASKVHKDPRAQDVGSTGALERDVDAPQSAPKHVDHGIDQVLKEDSTPHKDHGADPAEAEPHKDGGAGDVGAGGATHRT